MDLFDIDNVKTEKANAMRRYRRLRKIANMFRFFEICLVLMFLSWFSSTRLPTALRISTEFFQNLSVFVVSPRFVFLVGNAIILTLFAKSGRFPGQNSTSNGSGTDLYDEFIMNSEKYSQKISTDVSGLCKTEEIVYHDKQTVYEESSDITTDTAPDTVTEATDVKIFRRTQSENLNQLISEKPSVKVLRRSATEKCRKVDKIPRKISEKTSSGCEEEMSNDEFRRKIEEFIAKQMRFRRQESMAIVLQKQSS